jgi:hypothetical protein
VTTALDLISRSLRMLGVYAKGESPDPSESADALMALNALMGSLSNTPLVYAKTLDTIALTAGVSSITVGPSGTTVTTRPVQVLADSYLTNGSVSYPLDVFTQDQYSAVSVKTTQGIPESITPLMLMPDAQLTFYPVPIGGLTLNLWSMKALSGFPTLTTTASLPPGYEAAIPPFLAEELAPEYQMPVPPAVQVLARRHRRNLANANVSMPILKTPFRSSHFNILTNGSV